MSIRNNIKFFVPMGVSLLALGLVIGFAGGRSASSSTSEVKGATLILAEIAKVMRVELMGRQKQAHFDLANIQTALQVPDSACSERVRDEVLMRADLTAARAMAWMEEPVVKGLNFHLEALSHAFQAFEYYEVVHRRPDTVESWLLACKNGGAQ